MIAAGHQPCYLPSLSLFALMKRADFFIHCPRMQFVRKSWHHRNFIKMPPVGRWMLSIPISHAGDVMPISDVVYEGDHWKKKHLKSLRHAYRDSPFFDQYYPGIKNILESSKGRLSDLNINLTDQIATWLGLSVPTFLFAGSGNDAIENLIEICELADAHTYLSKLGASEYIGLYEEERLARAGIKHTYLNWSDPDEKPLSAIHHLFTLGPDAKELIE